MLALQDSGPFLKPTSHTWFMLCPPPLPRTGWTGVSRPRQTKGALSHPPLSYWALTVFSKAVLLFFFFFFGCHRFFLSPWPAKFFSMWKVFNFWINPEAYLLVLWRAHADFPMHSPWMWIYDFRLTSFSVSHDCTNGLSCTFFCCWGFLAQQSAYKGI